mmetsp:Transcript_21637/g.28978  ORF Transcript_21637/g.28978 Transcript_21637/m.28978 type:complete len:90 (+) Transcript_21637:304-573(+)
MIAVYYVVNETEVTSKADLNRKELTLDLALFCFQWIATFWTFVFALGLLVLFARRGTFWANVGFSSVMLALLPIVAFAYYRNILLLKQA